MPPQKIHFPALDSLRAIAMLMVFADHLHSVAYTVGVRTAWRISGTIGTVGLKLFFILSGFLITFLLLMEREERQRIDVPHFYLRRILRIWPLYFLIVGIAQFLIPCTGLFGLDSVYSGKTPDFWRASLYYLLFLPNLAFIRAIPNALLGFTWSIGVEEQFYLVWPLVVRYGHRFLPFICAAIIALFWISFFTYVPRITTAIIWSNIGFFALGAMAAWCKISQPAIVRYLSTRLMQVVVPLLCIYGVVAGNDITYLWIPGVPFALAILQASQPETLIGRLRYPWLTYLGKISYGMYIFHVLVITIVAKAMGPMSTPDWLLIPLAFAATVVAGTFSYYGIERPFLRMRRKFGSLTA
jgi:peptidoglycan/LPS O-acetylase OafA/YrhL